MKKVKSQVKPKQYRVLIGCNTSDEKRYEAGDVIDAAKIPADDLKHLLIMGAIEIAE